MKQLTKLNILNKNHEIWPDFFKSYVQENLELCSFLDQKEIDDNLCDYLYFSDDNLTYHSQDLGKMSFDFEQLWRYHHRQKYAISKEPLAKALGISGDHKPLVWDATAGSGKDLTLIHIFGAKVIAFERNALVYLLLQDALRRFPMSIVLKNFSCTNFSASDPTLERPNVIYYDPMYPEKTGPKKSALPRKEMRIFKDIVGEDLDFNEFFKKAMTIAKDRVVIKRPLHAPDIGIKATACYKGKSTRYDMYKIF